MANEIVIDQLIQLAKIRCSIPAPAIRKRIRERAGLTQAEIARVLGISREAISRYESGEREPRRSLLDTYAALLDRLNREVLG